MVSLCSTVLNEADSIVTWVEGLLGQTRAPDEIVICDAGSTDGTAQILNEFAERDERVVIIVEPGVNISQGRNLAISQAIGDLIAVTDAGTIAQEDWLEQIVEPLERDPDLAVSAGFYRPAGRNFFEIVLATVITPRFRDLYPEGYPPSSRSVAFRKSWWQRVGGYPEWLNVCEDLVFSISLKQEGAKFQFSPGAIVAWYPRPDAKAFFRQYYEYARGDGHARLYAGRHALRYFAYGIGVFLAWHSLAFWPARVLLSAGVAFHMKRFFGRVRSERPFNDFWKTVCAYSMVPMIVVTGDVAKMLGYPRGLHERWKAGSGQGLLDADIRPHREPATNVRKIKAE